MTWARSLGAAAAPPPRCAPWWPVSAAGASASTWWTPTSSRLEKADMDLVVGRVVKAHGISGEVVVEVRTDDPGERFSPGSSLRSKPGARSAERAERTYVVESVREHGG